MDKRVCPGLIWVAVSLSGAFSSWAPDIKNRFEGGSSLIRVLGNVMIML